ncbi:hypothetical protein [Chryseobacterium indoltheticum]|jgi:hypothetical protein|uniref:Uncharacterized protein n=1 Tax=Chryseobacterium indoltheticum TaxID=254 RepID=A0A381F545_9FLAO|nr:hypothetical protein [Chryseobacterium indoltheticum]AZA75194.1 hypothetical protein EG358_16115 [Chryseobacterium indoltheticum]SIR14139.1 hypothetical protein SAMN05421682_11339 [Chryseobacterium indoltheticum]SUX41681.1 Uncharacterised protein [Chryseobacterium indoltheticum]
MNYKKDIEDIFELSKSYLNKCLGDDELANEIIDTYGELNFMFIINEVQYIFYNKNEWLNNCYRVNIDIEHLEKKVGHYILYLDDNRNFVDEFFHLD